MTVYPPVSVFLGDCGEGELELDGGELAEGTLTAPAVVGVLDPDDDLVGELGSRGPAAAVEDVLLEQRVERLHRGVVAGGRDPAHRPGEPVRLEHRPEGPRAKLAAAVGVNDHGAVRLAASDRRAQRRDGEVGGHPVADRVADDPVGEHVLDAAAVELAFAVGCSVMSVNQTTSGPGAVKSRCTRSSCTAGPGASRCLRPFFVVVDQTRCSEHSRQTRRSQTSGRPARARRR